MPGAYGKRKVTIAPQAHPADSTSVFATSAALELVFAGDGFVIDVQAVRCWSDEMRAAAYEWATAKLLGERAKAERPAFVTEALRKQQQQ